MSMDDDRQSGIHHNAFSRKFSQNGSLKESSCYHILVSVYYSQVFYNRYDNRPMFNKIDLE